MTPTHRFTELNKNVRRVKVSPVQCLGKDWAPTVTARSQGARTHGGCPWGWAGQGPSHWPSKGVGQAVGGARGRLGGQPGASPSPAARHICGDTTGLRPSRKVSLQVRVWVISVHSQAGLGQGWGQGHLHHSWSRDWQPRAELKWGPLMQNQVTLMPFILQRALHKTRQLGNTK